MGLALADVALEAGLGPVLLVEANAQNPALAHRLGRSAPPDLAQVVELGTGWRDAIAEAPGAAAGPALAVLGPQPFRLVGRADFGVVWTMLQEAFRLIVIDSAGIEESPAMATLPHALGAQVVLVATEETTAAQARRTRDALLRAHAPILGVILNKRATPLPPLLDRIV
ncbi:hypothetical protein [Zavarzinia sp. CC-PAN008]|uniref:hypothetical protein n=1 Tax=Zavarzinia sp. CC-PAN008 TaxID=3243332 RepID=UPI003F7453CF